MRTKIPFNQITGKEVILATNKEGQNILITLEDILKFLRPVRKTQKKTSK